jgi:flagellin
MNSLLLQIRGLAVDAANNGANDSNSLAADQAQITNAIATITRIATSTQFGSNQLLDGSHAAALSSSSGFYTASATGTVGTGSYNVAVTTAGTAATYTAGTAATTATAAETLTVNNIQVAIANGDTAATQVSKINAVTSQSGVGAVLNGSTIILYSTSFGTGHKINVSSSAATSATGLTNAGSTSVDGTNIVGTINGISAAGLGNTLTALSGAAAGLSVTVAPDSTNTYTSATNNPFTTDTAGAVISVDASKALLFQIGANAGQNATLSIQNMAANALGQNVVTTGSMTNLSQITVLNMTPTTSGQVLQIIDKAISDVATSAGTLGAFQNNTLQAVAANLQTSLQNTTAANSTIRDTNFAVETAAYTQNQVLVQAGTQVLKNSNQIPQLVLALLQ